MKQNLLYIVLKKKKKKWCWAFVLRHVYNIYLFLKTFIIRLRERFCHKKVYIYCNSTINTISLKLPKNKHVIIRYII